MTNEGVSCHSCTGATGRDLLDCDFVAVLPSFLDSSTEPLATMDIVTHAAMGTIVAGPFFGEYPLPAAGLMLGSALPDLDALSRVFGKRVFLTWHQTFTHSVPLIAMASVVGWYAAHPLGPEFQQAVLALGIGMVTHVLLDLTNTYGVKFLFPFSKRRLCLEWVFFIDASVIALSVLTIVWLWADVFLTNTQIVGVYLLTLIGYWLVRIALRRQALRRSFVDMLSLIPSALWPWVYYGCRRSHNTVQVFRVDVMTRKQECLETYEILDDRYADILETVPEFRVMNELTPAYHVVSESPQEGRLLISCRDLRTTNFNPKFGQLALVLEADGLIAEKRFHV